MPINNSNDIRFKGQFPGQTG